MNYIKMYLPFIFGLLFGFVYGKNDIHKRVISYDKYLICHRIVDYPFGQPKCYASNELYIAYYINIFCHLSMKLMSALAAYMITKNIYEKKIRDCDFWFGMTYGIIYSMIDS